MLVEDPLVILRNYRVLVASGRSLGHTKHHRVLGACGDPWAKLSTMGCLVLVRIPGTN